MANFRIIRDIEALKALEAKWEGLFAKNNNLRFSQRFDWNYGLWSKYYAVGRPGCALFVIDGYQDGHAEQQIIVPLMLDETGTLRFIGDDYADVMGEVVAAHDGDWHIFYRDLVRFIQEQPDVKNVKLTKMLPKDELLRYLGVYYDKCTTSIKAEILNTYLSIRKSDGIDDGFPQLSAREKQKLKNHLKKDFLRELKILSTARGNEFPRGHLVALRDQMVAKGIRNRAALPDGVVDVFAELYKKGLAELAVFENTDGFDFVSHRIFEQGGRRIVSWIALYDDAQLTTQAHLKYMLSKMQDGDWVFDFGTGAYSYKLGTFRPDVRWLYKFETKQRTLANLVADIKGMLRFYIKPWLKKILDAKR